MAESSSGPRDSKWFARVTWAGVAAGLVIFSASLALGPHVFVTNQRFEEHLGWSNDHLRGLSERLSRVEEQQVQNTAKIDRLISVVDRMNDKIDQLMRK